MVIIDLIESIEYSPVDQSEVSGVVRQFICADEVDEFVERRSCSSEDAPFLSRPSYPIDHRVAVLPEVEKLRDEFGGILQVGIDLDGGITARRSIPREDGALEPKVAGEAKASNSIVGRCDSRDDLERAIGGVVVGEEELEAILLRQAVRYPRDAFVQVWQVVGLVVDGNDDRDELSVSHQRFPFL